MNSRSLKLFIKKIFFVINVVILYFFKYDFNLKKSTQILDLRSLYESSFLSNILDKLFFKTNRTQLRISKYKGSSSKKTKDSNHIIICLTNILNPKTKSHASLYLIWANLYLNANKNNKVTFFITNENKYLNYFLTSEYDSKELYYEQFKSLVQNSHINLKILEPDSYSIKENISKACEQILQLKPTHVVFFSGWNCDSPYVRKILFKIKPVLFHFTQDVHSIPKFAHLAIMRNENKLNLYKRDNIPKIEIGNYYFGKKENISESLYDNQTYIDKFKEDKHRPVRIATILSNRIEKTLVNYTKDELKIYLDFIENNNVIWYLVGIEDNKKIENLGDRFNYLRDINKIIIHRFIDDLDGFLKDLDILCFIPGLLGGSGVAQPALTYKTFLFCSPLSDVASFIEKKYVCEGFHDFFNNLKKYVSDVDLRVKAMISQNLYLNRYSQYEINKMTSNKLMKSQEIYSHLNKNKQSLTLN